MSRNKLELAGALGHATADKRVEILRRVAAVGSISQAARDAGVSYKAAWQALDTLSNLAGAPLLDRAVGGTGGGGARPTPAGEQVLHAADEMARARLAVLGRLQAPAPALGGIALRTSMRNQLPATVAALRPRAGAMEVGLTLAGGDPLVARITRESVQLLGLKKGLPVLALCKATAVGVAGGEPDAAAVNQLAGTVTRAPRASGGEVALSLAGGLQLVGFAEAGSGLRKGAQAVARVEPSAVVVALGE
ncbi:TOBE domain-containing protein [Ramlibacter sp. G-1-2-2]|uniref:TOBE domain-containing protein n=1 Tax=Ramlibacter agri TaxID=2728837 RepID=A0A848HG41_9BURK|nr:TOBE domain-containing protein [Ramlibacter agri]NML46608.1 TOBE domain-containing protein [Ramlibacter agri]